MLKTFVMYIISIFSTTYTTCILTHLYIEDYLVLGCGSPARHNSEGIGGMDRGCELRLEQVRQH